MSRWKVHVNGVDRLSQRVSANEATLRDLQERMAVVEKDAKSWAKFTWVVNKLLTVGGLVLAYFQLRTK